MVERPSDFERKLKRPIAIAIVGLLILVYIFETTYSIFIASYSDLQIDILHSGLLLLWVSILWVLLIWDRHVFEEKLRIVSPKKAISKQTDSPFIPDPSLLLGRSDALDKERSNLRNGISILFGIGTALSLWSVNLPVEFDIKILIMVGSMGLMVMAIFSILLSLIGPTTRSVNILLGEGLIPLEMTKEEYLDQIKLAVFEKENTLSNMRKLISIGLSIFFISNAGAILTPMYSPTPLVGSEGNIYSIFMVPMYFGSLFGMTMTLFLLGLMIARPQLLGLINYSITKKSEDSNSTQ